MKLDTDRIAGLFIAGLGLVLLIVVFPIQIEAEEFVSIHKDQIIPNLEFFPKAASLITNPVSQNNDHHANGK